jgi:hypothetical protein
MARHSPGKAAAWFTQALAAYRQLADERHTALTLSNLADALTEDGRTHEAITGLEEADPLLAPFGWHRLDRTVADHPTPGPARPSLAALNQNREPGLTATPVRPREEPL